MDRFKILDWDSQFFGMTVARIVPEILAASELEQTITDMKNEGVALAYWASDPNDEESQRAGRVCGGFLADKKVTFVIDLEQALVSPETHDWSIEKYTDTVPSCELEHLALQAGIYSRFRIDPRIPVEKFAGLYRIWIQNSVSGQIADAVLVVRHSDHIVGMVTVGEKNGCGDIGLIAVDGSVRGKNVGGALVYAAQEWSRRRGLKLAQVVTQGENAAACRLYEKCGYRIGKIENVYHFWI